MHFGKVFFTLGAIVLLSACVRSQNRPGKTSEIKAGSSESTLEVSGVTRHYRLYVPTGYTGRSPVALIINFHGWGATSLQEEGLSGMSAKAEEEGFIVAYPDGLNQAWNDAPGPTDRGDLGFVKALIQILEGQYSIDPKRIYATGISNGGGMTNRVGCDLSALVAAIGPVEGAYNFWKECHPERAMPVVAFHGTTDSVVPYYGVGDGNISPPIPMWAAGWAQRNGCAQTPTTVSPHPDVKIDTWSSCKADASVVLYSIDHHGHSWPGSRFFPQITSQAVIATEVMWDFFKAHPMP
jgi:polyhydroxybutyrate depolymerase